MNTEQERALLPCPFCGGEPSITKQMDDSPWSHDIVLWTQVQCDGCEAHVGPTCEGFEVEAVDIWNRRAALQSQPTEAFPCQIIEADFETGTVTLEMEGKYTVSAGQKYLCNAPLQSQDREDAQRFRKIMNMTRAEREEVLFFACDRDVLNAIDHARRIEGDGE